MNGVFLDSLAMDDLDLSPISSHFKTFTVYPSTPSARILERSAGATALIINKVRLDRAILTSLPELRLICLVATGSDNIDLAAAHDAGIAVYNCQAYGTDSVVQHVFTVLLALHTNLLPYTTDVGAGLWQQARQFCLLNHPITEIRSKRLGIVGYGTLGQGVADVARAFGMEVLIAARPGTPAVPGRIPLEALLPQIDVLSLHCPLTATTRSLIDTAMLCRLQPHAFLINTARGGIVDEAALADALRSGRLAGAAMDVLVKEPPDHDSPLLAPDIPNLILTPHIAWASLQARQRIVEQTAENITGFLDDSPVRRIA
ncbi:MAG: glycerate dehydrogenase [Deltaproteobacteria bacterium]|nr:MAG: glycerate dehydrogenase [Deltaproteobacteria bacterium]